MNKNLSSGLDEYYDKIYPFMLYQIGDGYQTCNIVIVIVITVLNRFVYFQKKWTKM